MFDVGYRGWLKLNLTKGAEENLSCALTPKFEPNFSVMQMPFHKAADYTAKLMSYRYENLHLFLSGGLDSEYVATTLLRNKIAFTPVIVKTPYNAYETWYAEYFCSKHQIVPVTVDCTSLTDWDDVLKTMLRSAVDFNLPVRISLLNIAIASRFDDASFINGFGEPFNNSTGFKHSMNDILHMADHDFFFELCYGSKHPGAFFTWTPEIFRSLITSIDYSKPTQLAKAELYGINPRPKMHEEMFITNNAGLRAAINSISNKLDKNYRLSNAQIPYLEVVQQLERPLASSRFTNSASLC